jgi:hypothetical protein
MGLSHSRIQEVEKRVKPDNIKCDGPPDGGHVREGGDTLIARRVETDITMERRMFAPE